MKTLLINPPYNPNIQASLIQYDMIPLGIGSLAGVLEAAGLPVEILDALPMRWEEIASRISTAGADIFGITTYTHSINQVRQLCSLIKYLKPGSLIVLGGHHFDEDSSPLFLSKVVDADVIVMGEGEEVFLDLVTSYLDKGDFRHVKHIVYRDESGSIVKNGGIASLSDINSLPLMPYHLFDLRQYLSEIRSVVSKNRIEAYCRKYNIKHPQPQAVLFSKGCKGKCTFCGIFHKNVRLRARNIDHIISEIATLRDKYNYRFIRFVSANMANDMVSLQELCQRLIDLNLDVMWDADIRIDGVDETLLRLMAKSGCYTLFFGVESGSRIIQRAAHKVTNRDKLIRVVELCRTYEIEPVLSFISGLPGESYETYMETVDLIYDLGSSKAEIRCKPAFVLPRTLLFEIMKEQKGLNDNYWFTPLDLPIFTGAFPSDELERMSQRISWHGYLSTYKSSLFRRTSCRGFLVIGVGDPEYTATVVEMLMVLHPKAKIYVMLDKEQHSTFLRFANRVQIVENKLSRKNYDHVFLTLNGRILGNNILRYYKYLLFKPHTYIDFKHRRILNLPFYYLREVARALRIHHLIRTINNKLTKTYRGKAARGAGVTKFGPKRLGDSWGCAIE